MTIRIVGHERVRALLNPEKIHKAMNDAVGEIAQETKVRMAAYPPESAANQPGGYPKRWYQRGFGSRWARQQGGVGGKNTSENLQKSWKIGRAAANAIKVFTTVSYADEVQARAHQSAVHRRHGWQTDAQVISEMQRLGRLGRIISKYLGRIFTR